VSGEKENKMSGPKEVEVNFGGKASLAFIDFGARTSQLGTWNSALQTFVQDWAIERLLHLILIVIYTFLYQFYKS